MARKFLTAIDLAQNELQNARVQNIASAPGSPVKGQLYFDSTTNILYWYSGTAWVPAQGGVVSYGTITAETSFGASKADGVATTLARSDHAHGNPTHVDADHAAIHLNSLAVPTADVSMGGFKLTNVGAPIAGGDATNKTYVDNAIAGLTWRAAVDVATTGNVPLTGNGQTIDGIAAFAGTILVKNQTNQTENGVWSIGPSAWTRRTDLDSGSEFPSSAVFVKQGTVNADTAWVCTNDAPPTIGTTNIVWAQFAGGGTVTAGAGMTQSGNTLNVIAGDTTLTVAADDVRVNTAVIATVASIATVTRKAAQLVGNGAAVAFVLTHNLSSRDVTVGVYRNSAPYDEIDCDVEHTDINNVTLRFAVAPSGNEYKAVFVG